MLCTPCTRHYRIGHESTENIVAPGGSAHRLHHETSGVQDQTMSVFYSLKPMFATLAGTGSCPPDIVSRHGKSSRALYWTWHVIIATLLNMFTAAYLLRVLMMINSPNFWHGALAFLRLVTATFYFDVFRFRWKSFLNLLRDIDGALLRYPSPKLRMNFMFFVVVGWSYVLVATILAYMEVVAEGPDAVHIYIKRHFFGLTFPAGISSVVTHTLVGMDVLAKSIIIRSNITFGIVIFLCTCHIVTRRFAVFNDVLEAIKKEPSSRATIDAIDALRDTHEKLRQVASDVDTIFNHVVLLWFNMAVIVSCSEVTNVVTGGFHAENVFGFLSFALHLLFIFTVIGSMCIFGAFVQEQASRSLPIVYEISTAIPISGMTLLKQLELLRLQLTYPPIGISAGKFFTLTRGALLTAFSVIVSYVILVIQMSPK